MIRENEFKFILIFIAVLFISIVTICVFFGISRSKLKEEKRRFKLDSSSCYVYVIDLARDVVVTFDRKNVKTKTKIFVNDFLSLFNSKDTKRIMDWLQNVEDFPEECERYLEVESASNNKKCNFVLLSFKNYDKKKRTIFLEGTVLNNLYSSEGRKKIQNEQYYEIKKAQIEKAFKSNRGKGYTYSIRFFYIQKEILDADNVEKDILLKLKNEIYPFAKAKRHFRYILNESNNRMFVYDFRIRRKSDALILANSLSRTLSSAVKMNGYTQICGFSIGVANCSDFTNAFDMLNASAEKAAVVAKNNGEKFYFYEPLSGGKIEPSFNKNLIDMLFSKHSLRYTFRPIYNVKKDNIFGYFTYVKCFDSSFSSYYEMASYANKVDRNRELFAQVSKHFVSKFYTEAPNSNMRLFLNVSLVDLEHLSIVLNNIPSTENINLVLMFEESELNANSFSQDLLFAQLSELKSQGFETALLLKNEDLLLDPEIYSNFSYFALGSSMVSKIRVSNRIRLSNRFLIEQLLQFKRPIIATDLDGWPSIELILRAGCLFVSSDDISQSSDMILPIEKKKIQRIKNLIK